MSINQEKLREIIDSDDVSAEECLQTYYPNAKKKFKSIVKKLNELLTEIQTEFPDAQFYLEDAGNFNLMLGDPHTSKGNGRPNKDFVATSETLKKSGGGGW